MDTRRHIRSLEHGFWYNYPKSILQRLRFVFTPLVFMAVLFLIFKSFAIFPVATLAVSPAAIGGALLATFIRLLIAYVLALAVSIPLALLVTRSPLIEKILLPIFDTAQSVPVLAFFPVVIIFFVHFGLADAAAIFIIFISMLWNIVFSLIGGLNVIPSDIKAAAHVFGVRGFNYVRKILLPAVVPYVITGSLLAWAQGWNIIIVAEVLHTYIPGGTTQNDLFGIGSMLVNATANGQNGIFLVSILAMIFLIALMNFLVWQKLLRYAERYKFE